MWYIYGVFLILAVVFVRHYGIIKVFMVSFLRINKKKI